MGMKSATAYQVHRNDFTPEGHFYRISIEGFLVKNNGSPKQVMIAYKVPKPGCSFGSPDSIYYSCLFNIIVASAGFFQARNQEPRIADHSK